MAPYTIDPSATAMPDNVARLIYATTQEGVPTAFLQWNQGTRERGAQIALLHLVLNYIPRMGMSASPWDELYFPLKRDVTCGAIAYDNRKTAKLHQIGSIVHFLTDLAIDSELAHDPGMDLLGPFITVNADVEPLRVCKTIYLPVPFIEIFL